MFDWLQFPEGRARFAGIKRGWDEQGHVNFSLELGDALHFGEIDQVFLPDLHNFNIEVISFGYPRAEVVGMPGAAAVFSPEQISVAMQLIGRLIKSGLDLDRPPNILTQTAKSKFLGELLFREGWALVRSEADPR
ncbi:hypothetical protein GLA29479_2174 [Lysobacter antibioticus]|uniref:hypothetical protein n=1 Tax=Lysobacter antibioticus TaxID=84531 RepID=UPI0007175231|nr:hypothetical protein [Lysobacter antibioticus]ALN63044.1 hypothetical protein GLA29479_2174 [Lysobacter antibioticus]